MLLFNLFSLLLTLYEVVVVESDCDIGQKVKDHGRGRTECVPCEEGTFRDKRVFSKSCSTCTPCDEASGSELVEHCTKVKDNVCQCREGFSPFSRDSAICKCEKGSGLEDGRKKCVRCKEGHFSTIHDSTCQKWKDCKSAGIKTPGTATSDVVCNEKLNSSQTTASPTSIKKDFLPLLTTLRPLEGVPTQRMLSSTTPVQHINTRTPTSSSSNTGTLISTAILILGIVGLLLLTAVTCKLHIPPCWQPKPAVQTKDSLCRRPVEESGDGSEASLKLNPEP